MLFIASALIALALAPSYLAISLAAPDQPAAQPDAKGAPDDAISIARSQMLVTQLAPLLAGSSSPSTIIMRALGERPSGVAITHISYKAADQSSTGEIQLVGTASRERVAAYRDALTADHTFNSVSVPVGALVGADGGHFSITIDGNF